MNTDDNKVYLPKPRVAFRKIGERFVLVNIEDNTMIKLNEVGTAIWGCLDGRTVEEIVCHVCEVFEVTEKEARADTNDFLQTLLERGLVEIRNG